MASRIPINCACGCTLMPSSMYRHIKSAKHKRLLGKKVFQNKMLAVCNCRCEIAPEDFLSHLKTQEHLENAVKFPTLAKAKRVMENLFDKADEMPEGEYLRECNACQNVYKFHNNPDKYSSIIHVAPEGTYRLNHRQIILVVPE